MSSFDLLYDCLIQNKTVITDILNAFSDKVLKSTKFDRFNFVVDDVDVVNKKIFVIIFTNVNVKDSDNLKIVYVNPHNAYSNVPCIYTKSSPNTTISNSTELLFENQYRNIIIDDNEIVKRVVLNLDTINVVNITNRTWSLNPGYNISQNTDILMQKLLGADMRITTETYNIISSYLSNYKQFKLFNIIKANIPSTQCLDSIDMTYNLHGFNLSLYP
ncbi:hypothetical protein HgNV_041 [Homarus gammarus nudivirus]|uniref:Uncharacterized protein n=1 Tax=Homarus gammarus nudivirus TaxID=2509616 RepID=A0A411HB83_9VIRU|nr:hypothetical protein KM727_gp41 [Homarus gammarus nudivirus]QBB28646.1 hypothetical protein HgNV_041 [Homarus gammarus nudivirus]